MTPTKQFPARLGDEDRAAMDRIAANYGLGRSADALRLAIHLTDAERTPPQALYNLLVALKLDVEDRDLILIAAFGAAGRALIEAEARAAQKRGDLE